MIHQYQTGYAIRITVRIETEFQLIATHKIFLCS